MATTVVAAAGTLPVSVVCDDPEVAAWAETVGASVIWRPGRGLNGAVTDGVASLAESGYARVVVIHADLPHAIDLAAVIGIEGFDAYDGVTLVPDRRDDGTNVVSVPTRVGFEFSYGPRSFERHCIEVVRLGLPMRVVREPRLRWDVDVPADLAAPGWQVQ
jgi:2-phospho-L-lactate/phosphoenolpyruvate guanylyltransferase